MLPVWKEFDLDSHKKYVVPDACEEDSPEPSVKSTELQRDIICGSSSEPYSAFHHEEEKETEGYSTV